MFTQCIFAAEDGFAKDASPGASSWRCRIAIFFLNGDTTLLVVAVDGGKHFGTGPKPLPSGLYVDCELECSQALRLLRGRGGGAES